MTVLWAVFDVYKPTVLFGLPRWVVDFELVMVVIVFDTRGASLDGQSSNALDRERCYRINVISW